MRWSEVYHQVFVDDEFVVFEVNDHADTFYLTPAEAIKLAEELQAMAGRAAMPAITEDFGDEALNDGFFIDSGDDIAMALSDAIEHGVLDE